MKILKRFYFVRRGYGDIGWLCYLFPVLVAWHSKAQSGVYSNGKNWIVESLITRFGVTFNYNGDEIWWLWPWQRVFSSMKYMDVSCGGVFKSLKEIDEFWERFTRLVIRQTDPEPGA